MYEHPQRAEAVPEPSPPAAPARTGEPVWTASRRPALSAAMVLRLQAGAGNAAVAATLARQAPASPGATAPVPAVDAQMDADVEAIAAKLKEQVLDAEDEQEVVGLIAKWADSDAVAAGHGHAPAGALDRFLTKLKLRPVTRATMRSAFVDTTVNAFDSLFHELEDDRLARFEALLARSSGYKGAKPVSGPSENVWATIGRQELIGMFGMMKGLSTGLAGVGDAAVWGTVTSANTLLSPFGGKIEDPAKLADLVGKQLDTSGDAIFDGEFTGGQELFLGQNAASIGTAGGGVIWNLVMLHGLAGAGSTGGGALPATLKALDLVGRFRAVDDAIKSMGDYLLRMQERGLLDRGHLLEDDQFKIECFKLAGAVVSAVAGGLGARRDTAQVVKLAMDKLAVVFKGGEIAAKLGEISQLLMDETLEPAAQRAAVGKLVMELVADTFSIAGDHAAAADKAGAVTGGYPSEAVRKAAKAFAGDFSQDEALSALWTEAASGANDFAQARAEFWSRVNEGSGPHAVTVRAMLDAAGYELQGGTRAPLLRLEGWDARAGRELSDRVLSIDHKAAQSADPSLTLAPANLRFMTGRDNSTRGNRFDAADAPAGPGPEQPRWDQYREAQDARPPSAARRDWEADLRARIEAFKNPGG